MNLNQIPDCVKWIQYISPVRYAAEAYIRNEFDNNDKYDYNPIYDLGFNLGFERCLLHLLVLGVILRFVALFLLQINIRMIQ